MGERVPSFGSKLYDLGLAYGRRTLLVLMCVLVGSPVGLAQLDYRPSPPPPSGAADRTWYRNGAAIPFAGDLYYPAGPTVYFNGDSMVPSGEYDGVTLYTDTTVQPYSVLLVPVSDGLLRPYLPRPSSETASAMRLPQYRGGAGQQEPRGGYRARPDQGGAYEWPPQPLSSDTSAPFHLETVRKPDGNAGIWVLFEGYRWHQVGEAQNLDPAHLVAVGDYAGFPVYADPREPYIIYLPTRANLVAPFRRTRQ